MPVSYPYTQYGGIWKLNAASAAQGAGTWPEVSSRLYSWGRNANGELALNNTTNYSSPKQVKSLYNWLTISSGGYCNFAIKTDGTLWAWGRNNNGQLGLGNITNYSSPKQVGSLTNWLQISALYSTAAIKSDGTLWAWGRNVSGQLGLGNTTDYSSPKQVGSLTNWSYVFCGKDYTGAIKTDGTLWLWGSNASGQLGQGNTTALSSPKQVGSLTNWSKVSCGYSWATVAIKSDGTLWAWGGNSVGQLGLNNRTYYSSPKQVGSLTTWSKLPSVNTTIAAMAAIKTDNTLWVWGSNENGILGLGNLTNYSSPKQVGSLTNWSNISTFYRGLISVKTDGTLWTWGDNTYGQLGLNNVLSYSSPKQVGSLTNWLNVTSGFYNAFVTTS